MTDAIELRHSVRSFNGESLSREHLEALESAIERVKPEFGGNVTIRLRRWDGAERVTPGTYGVIVGARDFMLMAMGDDDRSALSAGFMMERIVLEATALGLGTCWLGGTFKDADFNKGENWAEGQRLRIVVAVGYPAGRLRLVERMTRLVARSGKRMPLDSLFHEGDFGKPLAGDSPYRRAFEMARLAPSSLNSQPWRAVVTDDAVHFYSRNKTRLHLIDCGIAISHFSLATGCKGEFFVAGNAPVPPGRLTYLVSWRRTE